MHARARRFHWLPRPNALALVASTVKCMRACANEPLQCPVRLFKRRFNVRAEAGMPLHSQAYNQMHYYSVHVQVTGNLFLFIEASIHLVLENNGQDVLQKSWA